MRCYHYDPLGHVHDHAPGVDLVLPCLASLLELQDVASLGSETTGLGQNLLSFWIKEVSSFLIQVELNAIAHAVIAVGAHPRNE